MKRNQNVILNVTSKQFWNWISKDMPEEPNKQNISESAIYLAKIIGKLIDPTNAEEWIIRTTAERVILERKNRELKEEEEKLAKFWLRFLGIHNIHKAFNKNDLIYLNDIDFVKVFTSALNPIIKAQIPNILYMAIVKGLQNRSILLNKAVDIEGKYFDNFRARYEKITGAPMEDNSVLIEKALQVIEESISDPSVYKEWDPSRSGVSKMEDGILALTEINMRAEISEVLEKKTQDPNISMWHCHTLANAINPE